MQRMGSMDSLSEARHQLNRLMRAHLHGDIDTQTFRNLTYAFSVMLSFFKVEINQPTGEKQQQAYDRFIENVKRLMGDDNNSNSVE